MQLVMFDIDGTLTESNALDDESYLQALSEVLGFSEVSNDWASYTHVTDACILREVCQRKLGRVPSLAEVEAFQKRFLTLLAEGAAASDGIKPIPGALKMLSEVGQHRRSSSFSLRVFPSKIFHTPFLMMMSLEKGLWQLH
jgi:beta-phosphoglucomutase-like phosphatase (HAD superfamily)